MASDRLKQGKQLIRRGKSDAIECDKSVLLVAFSTEEEDRLSRLVVEQKLPFAVHRMGIHPSEVGVRA